MIESVTRYGLGARGIDVISRTTSSGTALACPIYDAHGNNVGLISRNGANYAVSQERSYDAWGAIRSGIKDTTKLTYCANLGHKEDDESGLIYMRARYYEPGSGRFISEDPARDGFNWYGYAGNSPTTQIDPTGQASALSWALMAAGIGLILCAIWGMGLNKSDKFAAINGTTNLKSGMVSAIAAAALVAFTAASLIESGGGANLRNLDIIGLGLSALVVVATLLLEAGKVGGRTSAGIAVVASVVYGFLLLGELAGMELME